MSPIRVLLFFTVVLLYTRPACSQSKEVAQAEKRLNTIEGLYQYGSYREALAEATSLSKALAGKAEVPRHYYIQSRIFSLKINYAILEFTKVKEQEPLLLREIDALTNKQDKAFSYLYLTNYYSQTGYYLKASGAYAKAVSLNDTSDQAVRLQYELEGIKLLVEQKFFLEAKQHFAKAWALVGDTAFKTNKAGVILFENRKAKLLNLELLYLIRSHHYAEAEKIFPEQKEKIARAQGRNSREYSQCLELAADMAWDRQQYKKAFALYQEAYNVLLTSDYEQRKIYLLSQLAALSAFFGDHTGYDQYMRRLQLHADRNIYRYNYSQLAHGYADAYSYFVKSAYTNALSRLKKITAKYPTMPANHFFRQVIYKLESAIYQEDAQMVAYRNLLDTLSLLEKTYKGETSPAFYESVLVKADASIQAGDHSETLERKLKEGYASICPSRIDSLNGISCHYFKTMTDLYFQADRFQLAKINSEKAASTVETLYGQASWESPLIYIKKIEYAVWAGNYKEAKAYYEWLPVGDAHIKATHNSIQYTWFQYYAAWEGKLMGDLILSKDYSLSAMERLNKEYKNKLLAYTPIRQQAASTYIDISNLFVAEKMLLQSLDLTKQKLGDSDPSLLALYKELIRLYILNGSFTQADKTLTEYLRVSKKIYGEHSIAYTNGLFMGGQYFSAIGDHSRAKENFDVCLKIQQSLLGEKSLLLVPVYLALAQTNIKLAPEKFLQNEKLFKTAGSIVETSIGKDNQLYAQYLQELAEFYILFYKYNLATEMLQEANRYWESRLGAKNVHSADIGMLLGKIAYLKASYKEAEVMYEKARDIYESVFNTSHPSYAAATARLAKVAYMLNEKEKSLERMEVCIPTYLQYVDKYFPSLSFQEKSKFWFSMKEEFEFYDFLVLSTLSDSRHKLNGTIYNNILATKALLLSSDIKLRRQITSSGDTVLIQLFESWLKQKELLTMVVSYSREQLAKEGLDQRKIELTLESIEKEMSTRSELFQKAQSKQSLTWRGVQASLKENEYAVEIVRYRYFDKIFRDSVIYAALVVSRDTKDEPELVLLPDGKNMETRYLKYYRNAVVFAIEDEISYNVFWKPIKAKIPDNARIYISSDGVYNQLNVEMLFNAGTGKFVLDENNLVQLTNTKDVIMTGTARKGRNEKTTKANDGYILCGNPSFYLGAGARKTVRELPGAETEVKSLKELLEKNGKKTLTLFNSQVTEDTLKVMKNPVALHIATHGYFKETGKESEEFSSNPLLNSGLMVSGAGNIVDGKNSYVNSANGILTAYEVVNMQLDNTEIVILSACETGKGHLKAGEGVYGLQRSFLVAGANSVVLSLFKVDDEVTKELMINFYTNWLQTNDRRQAFVEAKKTIKEKYKSPIYWGAFIMIEGNTRAQQSKSDGNAH